MKKVYAVLWFLLAVVLGILAVLMDSGILYLLVLLIVIISAVVSES